MNRILLAFRAFFALLFGGKLPDDLVAELGLAPKSAPAPKVPPAPAAPQIKVSDGALQLLGMLQREARILDFLMEEIGPTPTSRWARPRAKCMTAPATSWSATLPPRR